MALMFVGFLNCFTALIFSGLGMIPSVEIKCPKSVTVGQTCTWKNEAFKSQSRLQRRTKVSPDVPEELQWRVNKMEQLFAKECMKSNLRGKDLPRERPFSITLAVVVIKAGHIRRNCKKERTPLC